MLPPFACFTTDYLVAVESVAVESVAIAAESAAAAAIAAASAACIAASAAAIESATRFSSAAFSSALGPQETIAPMKAAKARSWNFFMLMMVKLLG